ncbi:MAG TPA: M23 family metallopeptidase, partial [Ferruginibacter sp.]|nr:M23 family metallopeptidase [Ferruginibacter sp.]
MRSLPGYTNIFFILLLSFVTVDTSAQVLPVPVYPRDYFQWPMALKPEIVANYGEMRPNHFHMGLDIRTAQKQNQPVSAAAEGYIAKVKIEPFGFGRAIYINHPNGLTTLYAHLNDFYPELENYIKQQQYILKSWRIELEIPANLFPVSKGQFIAYSGNTGGSQGPHVHFEIRNTLTDKVLNPLLFELPIADNVAPNILKLAVYNRRTSTYEQIPRIYSLKKVNGEYISSPSLLTVNTDKVSFA